MIQQQELILQKLNLKGLKVALGKDGTAVMFLIVKK